MTSKLVKLTSLQANNDLGDSSLLDFSIPQGGMYNLQNSYLSIMSEINTTEWYQYDETQRLKGVHDVYIVGNSINENVESSFVPYTNTLLVRNVQWENDKLGLIQSEIDSNVQTQNLQLLSLDFEQRQSLSPFNIVSYSDRMIYQERRDTPYRTLIKSSSTQEGKSSVENKFEIRVPLKDFLYMCPEVYDTSAMGKSRLRIELNTKELSIKENIPYPDSDVDVGIQNIEEAPYNRLVTTGWAPYLYTWMVKPSDAIIVNYIFNPAEGEPVQKSKIAIVSNVVYDEGNFEMTLVQPLEAEGTCTNISFEHGEQLFTLTDDIVNNTEEQKSYNKVSFISSQSLSQLKKWIGRPVKIFSPEIRNIDEPILNLTTTLVNIEVEYNYLGRVEHKYVMTFKDYFYVEANTTATNIEVIVLTGVAMNNNNFTDLVIDEIPAQETSQTITTLTLNKPINTLDLWTNQKMMVRDVPNIGKWYFTIKDIKVNETDSEKTDIVLNQPFTLVPNEALNGRLVSVSMGLTSTKLENLIPTILTGITSPLGSATLKMYNPVLCLQQLYPQNSRVKNYMSAPSKVLQYAYFDTEKTNIQAFTKNYNKLFNVPPNCLNVYLLIKNNKSLLSYRNSLESYRFKVDNIEKYTRPVVISSSLDIDNQVQTLNQSLLVSLRNFQSIQRRLGDNEDSFIVIPMCRVGLDTKERQVQITLNYFSQTDEDLTMFILKECVNNVDV